jgi:hypothetical protein
VVDWLAEAKTSRQAVKPSGVFVPMTSGQLDPMFAFSINTI